MAQKKISVKETAERLGKCQQFVRIGLQRGILPFGAAIKMSSKWTYYINPAKLKEYIGEAQETEEEHTNNEESA